MKKDSTSGSSVVPITGLVRKRETFHICRMIVSNRLNAQKYKGCSTKRSFLLLFSNDSTGTYLQYDDAYFFDREKRSTF